MDRVHVRSGTPRDVDAARAIVAAYVAATPITFDTEAPGRSVIATRFEDGGLVAERGGEVVGVAWTSALRPKPAYAPSVELTLYVAPDARGRGVGAALAAALSDALARRGLHRAYAFVTLPNPACEALVARCGMRRVGVLDEVGFKLGRYWSVAIYELAVC